MRRTMSVIAGAAVVAAIAVSGCSGGAGAKPAAAADTASDTSGVPTITAQGTGRATGVPDLLTVSLSIHTEGDTANATLAENSVRTQQMLDTAKAQGIDAKDVQTTNVSVGPRFDFGNPNRPRLIGYSADNSFTVKLRDLVKAGAAIDGFSALAGDFLQVQGIGYSIDDPTDLLATARTDAVKRAQTQAQQLGDAAGVKLGRVKTITEVPQFAPLNASGGPAADGQKFDQASTPVALAPGSQELTLQVTIVYEIAP